jgi:hypothetical protein
VTGCKDARVLHEAVVLHARVASSCRLQKARKSLWRTTAFVRRQLDGLGLPMFWVPLKNHSDWREAAIDSPSIWRCLNCDHASLFEVSLSAGLIVHTSTRRLMPRPRSEMLQALIGRAGRARLHHDAMQSNAQAHKQRHAFAS